MTQNHFAHFFWHELGHFYAINADDHNLERFNDPDRPPKEKNVKFKQRGYWFWAEFITEAICNHVSLEICRRDPNHRPENIKWTVDVWSPLLKKLQTLLDGIFFGSGIDEYSLAHYFATLLKDTDTVLFVKATEEGKLIQYGHDTPAPAGTIDATCIDELDEPFQPIMIELKGWLEKQLSKDQFWIIDEAGIEWLGRRIYAMDKVWSMFANMLVSCIHRSQKEPGPPVMGKQTANNGKTSNITLPENKCGKLRGFGGWPPINNNNFATNNDFRFSAVRIPAISGLLYHFKRYLHEPFSGGTLTNI